MSLGPAAVTVHCLGARHGFQQSRCSPKYKKQVQPPDLKDCLFGCVFRLRLYFFWISFSGFTAKLRRKYRVPLYPLPQHIHNSTPPRVVYLL